MEQLTTRAVCYVTSVSLCAAAQSSGANAKFWVSLEQRAVDVLEKVSSACWNHLGFWQWCSQPSVQGYRVLTTLENLEISGNLLILENFGENWGNLKFTQGKWCYHKWWLVLQYSMCCLSTFLKAALLLYGIRPSLGHTVWVKKNPPCGFLTFFPQTDGNFLIIFYTPIIRSFLH